MRVIAKSRLRLYATRYPDSKNALTAWYYVVRRIDFQSFSDLRAVLPSADRVGNLIVFNIKGNRYRLVTAIHFNRKMIFVRDFLTHADYNRGRWKTK